MTTEMKNNLDQAIDIICYLNLNNPIGEKGLLESYTEVVTTLATARVELAAARVLLESLQDKL